MSNTKAVFIGLSLVVYNYIGVVLISEISILLSILVSLGLLLTVSYIFRKEKIAVMFSLLAAAIFLSSTTIIIRDATAHKHCFRFNISYPGTDKYEQCVDSLTFGDYVTAGLKYGLK